MSRMDGCMGALGDLMAKTMLELDVSLETVGMWKGSYAKTLADCGKLNLSFEEGAQAILAELVSARVIVLATQMMVYGK